MKRLKELDILRGIAICFMVFGHTWFTKEATIEMERLIYAFHMPLFFIVSGFFYKSPDSSVAIKQTILKKARTLLVPYFVFGIIYIVLDQLVWKEYGLLESIRNIALFPTGPSNKLSQTSLIPGESALWFLMALFVMNLLYMLLDMVIKNDYLRIIIIVVIAIAMLIIFPENNHTELPFALRIVLECMPYFCIGIIFKKYYKNAKDLVVNHKVVTTLIWLVSFALYVSIATVNPIKTDYSCFDIFRNHWGIVPLSFINSLLGFFVFWIISLFIAKYLKLTSKFLSFCGASTIVFVCINHPVIKYVEYFVTKMSGEITSYYQMVVVLFLSLLVCVLVATLVMKTKLKVIFGK